MAPIIVDIFADVVSKTNEAVLPTLKKVNADIVNVNFLYDVPLQVVKRLTEWTRSESFEPKRYPLIALFLPIDENNGTQIGIAEIASPRLIIAGLSKQEWYSDERYAQVFRPILYVIFEELLNQMYLEPRFLLPDRDNIPYKKRDWPFYDDGKDSNPFNDFLDVIEVTFNSLKINFQYC